VYSETEITGLADSSVDSTPEALPDTITDPGAGAAIWCACDGYFREGSRVVALVEDPAGAFGLPLGTVGTALAGVGGSLPWILVEWDDWLYGHDGNCMFSECGTCIPREDPPQGRWWVYCNKIDLVE